MEGIKIAIAQINPTVGDLDGNTKIIKGYIKKARKQGADVVVFPELAVTGYPPKDLVLKPLFIKKNLGKLAEIAGAARGIAAIVGFVDERDGNIYNAAGILKDGEIVGVQHKTNLPNYDVFDEMRYFKPAKPARERHVFEIGGTVFGVNVCEDVWVEHGPIEDQAKKGAKIVINISSSPFHAGKTKEREEILSRRAKENDVMVVYCNLVGGQDDLVFDGGSYVFNPTGEMVAQAERFREDLLVVDLAEELENGGARGRCEGDTAISDRDVTEEVFMALVLGIRDYVLKNGFEKVVIGLSGGIDSSLTAVLAVEALGKENVVGVSMPGRVTSKSSKDDARAIAENLGIGLKTIPIDRIFDAYMSTLKNEFKGKKEDVTEENVQARIRGNILMALSNKFGYLVLSTGNKSETAIGYTTLYGDMAGGIAVISDVPKTLVYRLAEYVNSIDSGGGEIIPRRIILKEPTAELRIGQKDSDSLPPYEVLDPILHAYIEDNKGIEEILAMGFDRRMVEDVIRMVDHNEYKRQQAPPGIRVTTKAFGTGRRMPITNAYNNQG